MEASWMMTAIEARGVNHSFGNGDTEVRALDEVDLRIDRSEVVAFMGPSGSGKTTFLTLAGCLRRVQSGSLRVLGEELRGATDVKLMAMRRRMGFVFQLHNLHDSLTAAQNVAMGERVLPDSARSRGSERVEEALASVGLADRVSFRPAQLSGGQKQRVAIARALVHEPEVLFADEPTAALDAEASRSIMGLFREMAQSRGTAVLIVTHDDRVLDAADRVIRIEDGKILP
ncbi:MAG: ABC transporter ATP-binding protein [Planctomycetota bacterium]